LNHLSFSFYFKMNAHKNQQQRLILQNQECKKQPLGPLKRPPKTISHTHPANIEYLDVFCNLNFI